MSDDDGRRDWRADQGWDRRDMVRANARRRGRGRLFAVVALLVAGVVAAAAYVSDRRDPVVATPTATAPPAVRVTFPEGIRREEMAAIVEARTDLSGAEYLAITGPGAVGATRANKKAPTSLEGFLFPATYEVGPLTTVQDLVDQQLAAFDGKFGAVDMRFAKRRNLTPFDVLTIASMVEREVVVPEERPIVAGVMYNRLKERMRLDIDATVQYAVGDWEPLTGADLRVDSPYNTRKYAGLPPGPIANPGLPSIEAAARPTAHTFLFYVARDDGSGRHYFAKTIDEFEVLKQRARANAGG